MQQSTAGLSPNTTIRCLLFDAGFTLWERVVPDENFSDIATERALAVLHQYISSTVLQCVDLTSLKHTLYTSIIATIRQQRQLKTNQEPDFASAINAVLAEFALPVMDQVASKQIFAAFYTSITGTRRLYADAIPTLRILKQRGYLLGMVTNRHWGGEAFINDLAELGLLEFFPLSAIAVSADLGIGKPDPAIFECALDALAVTPAETAMVGDSLSADVAGAKALGMMTIWLPRPHIFTAARAELTTPTSETFETILFNHGLKNERRKSPWQPPAAPPDWIIEHLSDLLQIYKGVNKV